MFLLLSEIKLVFVDLLFMNIKLKVYYFNEIRWNGYWLVSVLEYFNIICIFIFLFCFFVVFDNLNKDDRGKIINEFLVFVV